MNVYYYLSNWDKTKWITRKFRHKLESQIRELSNLHKTSYAFVILIYILSFDDFFLEKKNSAGCILKTKWQMKICISFVIALFFSTAFSFRTYQRAKFSSPNKCSQTQVKSSWKKRIKSLSLLWCHFSNKSIHNLMGRVSICLSIFLSRLVEWIEQNHIMYALSISDFLFTVCQPIFYFQIHVLFFRNGFVK